jgi:hypothetical protein
LISASCLFLFARKQLASEHPLVNLRLFKSRDFTLACISYFVLGVALFGSVYLVPLYLADLQQRIVVGSQNALEYLRQLGDMLQAGGGSADQSYGVLMAELHTQAMVMSYNEAFFGLGIALLLASVVSLSIRPAAAQADIAEAPVH